MSWLRVGDIISTKRGFSWKLLPDSKMLCLLIHGQPPISNTNIIPAEWSTYKPNYEFTLDINNRKILEWNEQLQQLLENT